MDSEGLTDPAGALIDTDREPSERNVLTSIYWMLDAQNPVGFWCLNASDHVHYYHEGAALTYFIVPPDGRLVTQRLGPDVERGDVLQLVVEGGWWKAAELVHGDYCLIGEAVAPGFDFRDLRWATSQDLCAAHQDLFESKPALRRYFRRDAHPNLAEYYGGSSGGDAYIQHRAI
jgi:uncharacterized protein